MCHIDIGEEHEQVVVLNYLMISRIIGRVCITAFKRITSSMALSFRASVDLKALISP